MPMTEMSKLHFIKEELTQRTDVYVAGQIDKPNSLFASCITIITAPTRPLFTPDQLNDFMYGLSSLKPTQSDRASQPDPNGELKIGFLYFDQIIGWQHVHTTTNIEPVLPQALEEIGITAKLSSRDHSIPIQRRLLISVYPDPITAQAIYNYKKADNEGTISEADHRIDEYRLQPRQLQTIKAQYTSGPLAKLRQLVSR